MPRTKLKNCVDTVSSCGITSFDIFLPGGGEVHPEGEGVCRLLGGGRGVRPDAPGGQHPASTGPPQHRHSELGEYHWCSVGTAPLEVSILRQLDHPNIVTVSWENIIGVV